MPSRSNLFILWQNQEIRTVYGQYFRGGKSNKLNKIKGEKEAPPGFEPGSGGVSDPAVLAATLSGSELPAILGDPNNSIIVSVDVGSNWFEMDQNLEGWGILLVEGTGCA